MVKKKKKPPELYWSDFVEEYFSFCKSKFNTAPSFDNSAPRDLKAIIQTLRKRAEEGGIEWTREIAIHRFTLFLQYAFSDWWLSENWLLQNINRQKDKIIFKATKNRSNEMQ